VKNAKIKNGIVESNILYLQLIIPIAAINPNNNPIHMMPIKVRRILGLF